MTRRASMVSAEREVVRQCYRGLDVAAVQEQVLRTLRQVLAVDAAFFATADPETLLFTSAHAEAPLNAATPLFLANEFGSADVNRFAVLATAMSHVSTLDDATHGDRPASSRFRDIMRPLGLGDELRAALVTGSQCWGYLCLHRESSPLGFTTTEVALVARLGPHIAHALRQATLLHGSSSGTPAAAPGVVLLTENLDLLAMTPEAQHLLASIHDHPSGLPLPLSVYAVAGAVAAERSGDGQPHVFPSTRVRTRDGSWLNVHGSHLRSAIGDSQIAVVVEPVQASAIVSLLLSAYGLSVREADVARLVLRGASTTAIVDTLHISKHTVQDHLKAIFDKTGVRSRRDLVGKLLTRP